MISNSSISIGLFLIQPIIESLWIILFTVKVICNDEGIIFLWIIKGLSCQTPHILNCSYDYYCVIAVVMRNHLPVSITRKLYIGQHILFVSFVLGNGFSKGQRRHLSECITEVTRKEKYFWVLIKNCYLSPQMVSKFMRIPSSSVFSHINHIFSFDCMFK